MKHTDTEFVLNSANGISFPLQRGNYDNVVFAEIITRVRFIKRIRQCRVVLLFFFSLFQKEFAYIRIDLQKIYYVISLFCFFIQQLNMGLFTEVHQSSKEGNTVELFADGLFFNENFRYRDRRGEKFLKKS